MCIAISYVRWSHPSQSQGDSKRRQTEEFQKFCSDHNLTPSPVTFLDAGVSGRFGKNRDKGALGAFIKAVEAGKIKQGSVLVVEQLDRLSRLDLDQSLALFGQILRSGVNIGHVRKNRILTVADLKGFGVTEFAIELILAAEESQKKSERVGKSWGQKLANAESQIVTSRCPSWLKLVGSEWKIIEPKAAIVRQIFDLAIQGMGCEAICRRFNAEKVPCISRAATWQKGYVIKILTGRAVLGEYVATSGKDRKPVATYPNYYPAIIDSDTYYKAQAAIASRKHKHHGPRPKSVNPLQGLIKDKASGSTMFVVSKPQRDGSVQKQLVPSFAIQGNAKYWSFPLELVAERIYFSVKELQLEDGAEVKEDPLEALGAKLDGLKAKIAATSEAVSKTPNIESLLKLLVTLETEKASVEDQIENVKAERANKTEDTLEGFQNALIALWSAKSEEDRNAILTTLGAKLRALLDRIELDYQPSKVGPFVLGTIFFKDGNQQTFTCHKSK